MPLLKKQPQTATFDAGDRVKWDNDGDEAFGTVDEVEGKIATVTGEDGDTYTVATRKLSAAPEAKAKAKAGKKASGSKSFASVFNKTKPAEGGGGLPKGDWEALVIGGEAEETEKGVRAHLDIVGVNDEAVEGRTQKIMFFLTGADGEESPGLGFFKQALAKLGHDDVELEGDTVDEAVDNLNALLEEIGGEEPWISIRVVPQKNNPQYNNIYIQDMMDDQDSKPEKPAF